MTILCAIFPVCRIRFAEFLTFRHLGHPHESKTRQTGFAKNYCTQKQSLATQIFGSSIRLIKSDTMLKKYCLVFLKMPANVWTFSLCNLFLKAILQFLPCVLISILPMHIITVLSACFLTYSYFFKFIKAFLPLHLIKNKEVLLSKIIKISS